MSKAVKEFMMRDYESRFEGVQDALVVSVRGMEANDNNRFRVALQRSGVRVTVVRNALANKTFEGTGLEALRPVLEGPSALAYGGESVVNVARELVKWAKELELLELKGAVLDGQLFEGEEGVKRLSGFPTREEALAEDVTLILSPGRNLVARVKGPGSRLAGLVKAIEEKLEKGEAITKAS